MTKLGLPAEFVTNLTKNYQRRKDQKDLNISGDYHVLISILVDEKNH